MKIKICELRKKWVYKNNFLCVLVLSENCFIRNSWWIFYEKILYVYNKIVLSKVVLTCERKCDYLWDFLNCTSGQIDHWNHLPKTWVFKNSTCPQDKRATAGVKPWISCGNNSYSYLYILGMYLYNLRFD